MVAFMVAGWVVRSTLRGTVILLRLYRALFRWAGRGVVRAGRWTAGVVSGRDETREVSR